MILFLFGFNFWQNGIKKTRLEFICNQSGKRFQTVTVTMKWKLCMSAGSLFCLVTQTPLSASEHPSGRETLGWQDLLAEHRAAIGLSGCEEQLLTTSSPSQGLVKL